MDLAELHALEKSTSAPLVKGPAKNNRRALPTYKQAIREVILMREENEEEHQQRLARMVMTRWRLPVDRRLFEEQLILSLQVYPCARKLKFYENHGSFSVPSSFASHPSFHIPGDSRGQHDPQAVRC